ncbi:MAG: DUF1566 domain-containing protein [Treponema sp.]|nr:DUF1566 domain-containing protein [Treponema sp.]MCL2250732.1 DUF1566 domain-containing protein [Treponema sp.]
MNEPFYSAGKTYADITGKDETCMFLKQYSWSAVRSAVNPEISGAEKLKAYYIDLRRIEYLKYKNVNTINIEEIPEEFLIMPDKLDTFHMYLTSVNYIESGPFHLSELAFRAYKRLFSWDMYVLITPGMHFSHARDIPATRQILERYYPFEAGDTGPAGGLIIQDASGKWIEISPVDAGWCTWHGAERLCKEFSHNGYNDWRLPLPEELKKYAFTLRSRLEKREKVRQTNETTIHWSIQRNNDNAITIVTSENEDKYIPHHSLSYITGTSGGGWKSTNGPWRGDAKEYPITDRFPVRPVRDLNNVNKKV